MRHPLIDTLREILPDKSFVLIVRNDDGETGVHDVDVVGMTSSDEETRMLIQAAIPQAADMVAIADGSQEN